MKHDRVAFFNLRRRIWKTESVSQNIKIKLFKTPGVPKTTVLMPSLKHNNNKSEEAGQFPIQVPIIEDSEKMVSTSRLD